MSITKSGNTRNKKSVCLVTWQGSGNYGTCLQSFALHLKLQTLGYNVSFLRPFSEPFTFNSFLFDVAIKIGLFTILRKIKYSRNAKYRKTFKFQRSGYNMVYVNSMGQKKRLLSQTDVFITGSDQIWNTYFAFNPFFFLDFATENKKCISYASSLGTNSIATPYKDSVKKLLSKFQHISLREDTGVDVVNSLLGCDKAVQVIDPTLLLTGNDWADICSNAQVEIELSTPYALCYLVGNNEECEIQIERVTKEFGLTHIIVIPAVENQNCNIQNAIRYDAAGPLEFVRLIERATVVITDSFHATAFSINFSKPFVEFERFKKGDKVSQNSRIYNLLEHYGLQSHLFSESSNSWCESIDYQKVHMKLEADRRLSLDFLVNAIEN